MTFEEQKQRILQGKMYNDLTQELVEALDCVWGICFTMQRV